MKRLSKQYRLHFTKKEKITSDVYIFYFSKPRDFSFYAGQYLQLVLPHVEADAGGTQRFFTITSAPSEQYIMLTTKKTESSFKRKLFTLKKGEELQCFGPMGRFIVES